MAKRGRPTAQEREDRNARLLSVATSHFLTRGYTGTSLTSVAAEAGVTKRTVYTTFEDKAGLLAAVVRRQHGYASTTGPTLADTATGIIEALLADEAIALHRLVVAESAHFPDLASVFYRAGPSEAQDALVAAGARPSDAADLFTLLLGEPHRRRLLGLAAAPTHDEARARAALVLDLFA